MIAYEFRMMMAQKGASMSKDVAPRLKSLEIERSKDGIRSTDRDFSIQSSESQVGTSRFLFLINLRRDSIFSSESNQFLSALLLSIASMRESSRLSRKSVKNVMLLILIRRRKEYEQHDIFIEKVR